MGRPHKKRNPPPRQIPQIHPDALLLPLLLPYAQKIRNGRAIGFDEKFAVPVKLDAKELAIIHDGIREWLKHGTFDRLASILKDDPFRIVHPVIRSQIRHLASLSRRFEKTDSLDEFYIEEQRGPLLPEGTRLAARTALLTVFQGMWSAFSPSTILHMKSRRVRGAPPRWQKWEKEEFLEEYNALMTELEKFDKATAEAEFPLRRKPKESQSAYVKRITAVVQQLHSMSDHAYTGAKKRTGSNTWVGVIVKKPLPSHIARSIAQQAIPQRSVQKHILLAGMFAHYFGNNHTQWKKLDAVIQRAEAEFPHLHLRPARRS